MKGFLKYSFGSLKKGSLNVGIYIGVLGMLIGVNLLDRPGIGWQIGINAFALLIVTINTVGDYRSYKEHLAREKAKGSANA